MRSGEKWLKWWWLQGWSVLQRYDQQCKSWPLRWVPMSHKCLEMWLSHRSYSLPQLHNQQIPQNMCQSLLLWPSHNPKTSYPHFRVMIIVLYIQQFFSFMLCKCQFLWDNRKHQVTDLLCQGCNTVWTTVMKSKGCGRGRGKTLFHTWHCIFFWSAFSFGGHCCLCLRDQKTPSHLENVCYQDIYYTRSFRDFLTYYHFC